MLRISQYKRMSGMKKIVKAASNVGPINNSDKTTKIVIDWEDEQSLRKLIVDFEDKRKGFQKPIPFYFMNALFER